MSESNTIKDIIGDTINVGDDIIYASGGFNDLKLVVGRVIEITGDPKNIQHAFRGSQGFGGGTSKIEGVTVFVTNELTGKKAKVFCKLDEEGRTNRIILL
jgi:hypothetical protein